MRSLSSILGFAALVLLLAPAARAQAPAPLDYADDANWVCRPGKADACRDDLTATVLAADGSRRRETFVAARAPSIDCFYVYPTVSNAPGLSAGPGVTQDERRAVRQQFARFASVCRLYAPFYRQITATSMKAGYRGERFSGMAQARELVEADVEAAWRSYLAHDNHGRGVVLIGHSQGSGILQDLIRRRIEGTPVQRRMVSAILPGSWVLAPAGQDVGGTFKSVPACRRPGQIGCVIIFNAYRHDRLVDPKVLPASKDGLEPLCTNPAALAGGHGMLKPYLSATGETIIPDFTAPMGAWTHPPTDFKTPFVSEPGLFEAWCGHDEHGVYLAVRAAPGPADRRTGALVGDWIAGGGTDVTMGLHLIDLNLVQGNLIDIIRAQSAAYATRTAPGS